MQSSRRVVRLAIAGICLGMTVMIIAIAVVIGFQQEIKNKVNGFASHLQLVGYTMISSYQTSPIKKNNELFEDVKKTKGVRHVQGFAYKPGMMKVGNENHGVMLKGVGSDFDWSFFENNKVEGTRIAIDSTTSNDVWISRKLAGMMQLKIGDDFRTYFLNEGARIPRMRQFTIAGIYSTGLEEFDKTFVLADLRQVQRLNNWSETEISGYEIFVENRNVIEETELELYRLIMPILEEERPAFQIINTYDRYPQIFDWLNMLDMNVWILLILVLLVAGFNMISGLLVIILEHTAMIGALRAMGASHANIRKIFLYLSLFLTGKGLFWGNILGIGICLLQSYFGIIHLDPTSYYMTTVPISLSFSRIVLLNIGALFVIFLMLTGPSFVVSRISPDRTVRFD